ncbi:MAG TPA: NAD kinase [Bacteroidia bacterium]|jgi:NAD+ kinase|nr:NAD kinase [Bacteroidia bacterium]
MRIAIYGRPSPNNRCDEAKKIFAQLDSLGIEYVVHQTYFESLEKYVKFQASVTTFSNELTDESVDYLISIGGDGTLLESLPYVVKAGIPVLGINTGKLGFLSLVPKDDIEPAINALKEKKFTIQSRSLLNLQTEGSVFGKNNYALNEVCVQRKDTSTMVTIHTYINGEFLNSYWADGLIIATPTGSTAYSLSCSGPILLPEDSSFILTPIAPHNLNVRPVVIPDSCSITLKVEGRNPTYLVSLDSRSVPMDSTKELTIRKESFGVKLIQLHDYSFAKTLRTKLNWGKDLRNE